MTFKSSSFHCSSYLISKVEVSDKVPDFLSQIIKNTCGLDQFKPTVQGQQQTLQFKDILASPPVQGYIYTASCSRIHYHPTCSRIH